MCPIIDPRYKKIVDKITSYKDMSVLSKAALVLEEMDEAVDDNCEVFFDYYTMAYAVIETYQKERK